MRNCKIIACILLTLVMAFNAVHCIAQRDPSADAKYFISYPQKLFLRIFLSQKFAPLTIPSKTSQELNYKTNSKLSLGVGATYRSFTLNLSYGFSFLNKDKGQGTTKGLDLQLHIFPHKWAIDVLGTFVKGYYLDPKDDNGLNLSKYYQRPDFNRYVVGFTVYRVPNADKFSYKAAVVQTEWQKRSAGSILYGGDVFYGLVKGDSALVPTQGNSNFELAGITRTNFVSLGPGIGYAYTLVVGQHFFITGSATASIDLNFSSEEKSSNSYSKIRLIPGANYKGAIGYNSTQWSVSASMIGNALYSGSAFTSKEYFLPTGNIQFTITKKIGLKKY